MSLRKDPDLLDQESSDNESYSGFESSDSNEGPPKPTWNLNIADKDDEEEELERLVLGDKAGFREALLNDYDADGNEVEMVMGDADTGGQEEMDDAALFMFDTGGAGSTTQLATTSKTTGTEKEGDAPAWHDSDDEKLAVSLAGVTRLRKLRLTEAEDLVSGAEYSRRLRQQYLRLNPLPAWAKGTAGRPAKRRRRSSAAASDSSDEASGDSDDEDVSAQPLEQFLRDINQLAGRGGGKRRLRPEVIDIQRSRDIPDKHKAPIENLSFHPEYPVLLSSSTASVLYLHHIAPGAQPTPNPQLTSVQVQQVDVRQAEFLYPKGDQIFFAGRRRYFHRWDLQSGTVQKTSQVLGHQKEHKSMERFRLSPCGRYMAIVGSTKKGGGLVNVLNVATTQWVTAARLSSRGGIADLAWWSTGDGLTILGKDGQVGEYSVEKRSFVGIWHDEGSVGGIVVALGGHQGPSELGDDKWVAVGSNSGITNIYDRNQLLAPSKAAITEDDEESRPTIVERPTPTRRFEQLVTPITSLAFSPDGQLFAFGSRHKKDALRLVHLPTCTVYRNWPTEQTPLGRISAVAFGRQSDMLAVGNDTGRIRLWEIRN